MVVSPPQAAAILREQNVGDVIPYMINRQGEIFSVDVRLVNLGQRRARARVRGRWRRACWVDLRGKPLRGERIDLDAISLSAEQIRTLRLRP